MRYRDILLMIHELHRLGYQRLRIKPGMSASGMHWRCAITALGAQAANYGSAQERAPFGWDDAAEDTPAQLAQKFIARFGELCAHGRGTDQAYAGWYAEMLRASEPAGAPIFYADWELDRAVVTLIGESGHATFRLPPEDRG